MGTFKEINRMRKNQKVRAFALSIIAQCEKEQFTLADMKDLASVIPTIISEVIISKEEKTIFTVPPDAQNF